MAHESSRSRFAQRHQKTAPQNTKRLEKLNIAAIGCGGQGSYDLEQMESENIVALCDVDEKNAAGMYQKYDKAPKFRDYRVMLDKREKEIDAVLVATPDHTHAPASLRAMRRGKHVYCEKPLTWSIEEARRMAEAAQKYGVVTQMGTQGMGEEGTREGIEWIRSGVLGKVGEMHGWSDRPIWPQGVQRPTETMTVPKTMDWDLWLGAAPERPYHAQYAPFNWRGWYDFGTGAVGDMGIHNVAMMYVALKLGPIASVELIRRSEKTKETFPKQTIVRYEFAATEQSPALTFTWYDGRLLPAEELLKSKGYQEPIAENGSILVGERGTLYSIEWTGGDLRLLPEKAFSDRKKPAPSVPRAPHGHYKEWIQACKGDGKAFCDFASFGAPLTEVMLLGNTVVRHGEPGQKVLWNAEKMDITDSSGKPLDAFQNAEPIRRTQYRKGFGLDE